MKICLIYYCENAGRTERINTHLGIAYIASMLIQNGFMVDVYDCPFMNISYEQLLEYLKNNKYDAVGLSTYYFNSNDVLRISEYIKSLNDQIFVFIGGYLPTQYVTVK